MHEKEKYYGPMDVGEGKINIGPNND